MHGSISLNTERINRRKIFNDPVYGFITIPTDFIFRVIEHPYFQRLRRIRQLGLAELVYPGAVHSRFQHALGAMHLMNEALLSLENKGVVISAEEKEATLLAILLHDVGHGPFSHVLEHALFYKVSHETISELLIRKLNILYDGHLSLAISIFNGTYHRAFFHQLVSGQLDMDRLDYLNRDSFFTAVAEGKIGAERIIKMLNVHEDQLVVEEKGLMSVENFLVARQHMYWQVYLHKTAICAETILLKIFERVKDLSEAGGTEIPMPLVLRKFLEEKITLDRINEEPEILEMFVSLDDMDIWSAVKLWANHSDRILSVLSRSLLNRNLFKIKFDKNYDLNILRNNLRQSWADAGLEKGEEKYFFREGIIRSSGYDLHHPGIKILWKDGKCMEITEASELPTIRAISNIVEKNYLCYANDVYLQDISD
ncbi:HD domain-containing protein [Leadbetterella sp. DM7]|uniref:HD domain-containing protein n=1 Tax=Leadbetterella sp. DM7 TaxID=3235085 RepID=UPI00349EABEE